MRAYNLAGIRAGTLVLDTVGAYSDPTIVLVALFPHLAGENTNRFAKCLYAAIVSRWNKRSSFTFLRIQYLPATYQIDLEKFMTWIICNSIKHQCDPAAGNSFFLVTRYSPQKRRNLSTFDHDLVGFNCQVSHNLELTSNLNTQIFELLYRAPDMICVFCSRRGISTNGRRFLSSIQTIKKLRDELQAPLTMVKFAVSSAEPAGDYESARSILKHEMKKRGEKLVAKSVDRQTAEGWVIAARSSDGHKAIISILNCETDFVAKSDKIVELARSIGHDLADSVTDADEDVLRVLSQEQIDDSMTQGMTVKTRLTEAMSLFGESLRMTNLTTTTTTRGHKLAGSAIGIHCHGGPTSKRDVSIGRMGALISVKSSGAMTRTVADELAREVVAQNPESLAEFWSLEKVGDTQSRTVRQWAGEDIEITAWTRLER